LFVTVFFVFALVFSGVSQATTFPTFTLLDSDFTVSTRAYIVVRPIESWDTELVYEENFSNSSSTPLSHDISPPDGYKVVYASASASYSGVSDSTGLCPSCFLPPEYKPYEFFTEASATSVLTFQPNFSGQAKINYYYNTAEEYESFISFSDLTTSTSFGLPDAINWDSRHTYQLAMSVGSYANWLNGDVGSGGWMPRITTDMRFVNVPEPGTILLLGAGLTGIIVARRRKM
jgi:hypothetical protein